MKGRYNLRGLKGIIGENMLQFLLWISIFTVVFNKIADMWLSHIANANNPSIFTYQYSLGAIGLVFIIPAAILSILMILGTFRVQLKLQQSTFVNKIRYSKTLKIAALTSQKLYTYFLWLLKLSLMLLKGMLFILKSVSYAIVAVFLLIATISNSNSRSGGGTSYSGGAGNRNFTSSINKNNLRKQADWLARKKQSEANYAHKQVLKQGEYNIKTHHFSKRVNEAELKQREANKAAKRARNL